MIGQTISHYRIVEKLGEGGMGVVYKAEDTKLRRTVALKFPPIDKLLGDEDKSRFVREAQAAAALNHSNICTVYEIDESDGYMFIAMEFVEGQSVKEKMRARPLPLNEALAIAVQVADGLHVAHEQGIVHRDIKPANLMVTARGQVKVMDFGLAQVGGRSQLTKSGSTLGTAAYMSPEQTLAEPIDRRTDIWSLGVVIYEMITGQLPFQGKVEAAVAYAAVHTEPEPPTALRSGLPVELDYIVDKALAKNRNERYQYIDEMRIDLQAASRSLGKSSRGIRGRVPSVAVLPFVNLNRDEESEFFSDGITEDIINSLAKVSGLRVAARSSVFQFKGSQTVAQEVGRKLNVSTVLEGTVRRAGNRLRVTAELVGVHESYPLWSERYDRVMEDVFDIQDEISRAICEKLRGHLLGGGSDRVVKRHTADVQAYKTYLKGRYWWNRRTQGGLTKAKEYFEKAIEQDPGYALAYTGLGDCYSILGVYDLLPPHECFPKAKAAQLRALEIDPDLAAAHASIGFANLFYDWDPSAAAVKLMKAIELNPEYASAHQWYGFCLAVMGRLGQAWAEMNRANDLDPLSASINWTRVWIPYWERRFEEAISLYRRVVFDHPDFWAAHYGLGLCLLQGGRTAEAIAALEEARGLTDNPWRLCGLTYAYAQADRLAEAHQTLEELLDVSTQRYVSASRIAVAYAGLREKDEAFKWLDKARADRCFDLVLSGMEPLFDPLRSDPRFEDFRRGIVPAR